VGFPPSRLDSLNVSLQARVLAPRGGQSAAPAQDSDVAAPPIPQAAQRQRCARKRGQQPLGLHPGCLSSPCKVGGQLGALLPSLALSRLPGTGGCGPAAAATSVCGSPSGTPCQPSTTGPCGGPCLRAGTSSCTGCCSRSSLPSPTERAHSGRGPGHACGGGCAALSSSCTNTAVCFFLPSLPGAVSRCAHSVCGPLLLPRNAGVPRPACLPARKPSKVPLRRPRAPPAAPASRPPAPHSACA